MKTTLRNMLGLGALFGAFCAGAEDLSFIGTTDKNPLEYKLNETITFTVTLVDRDADNAAVTGRALRWTLSHDDTALDKSGTATSDAPLVVTTALASPGFARLKVEVKGSDGAWLSGNTQFFDGGAGADVMNIPEWPAPDDFASFWRTATNALLTAAYTPVCTNYTPGNAVAGVSYFLFELPTVDGQRAATGILAKPAAADPASCGIIATFDGYGFGATSTPNANDVLAGNIVLAVTRHGENPVCADAAYYTDLQNGEMKSFCFRNLDSTVEATDQYGMILRGLRALQYAKSLPEWNGTALKVTGGSMGGYQALAMAGLDADVTACSAAIPWHVDLSGGVKYGRMTGWRPTWTANLDYLDAKNFAKLIRCPVTFTAGLGDYVCPPSGEILLFKNLPEPKKATWTQNMGHGSLHGPNCAQYVMQSPAEKTSSAQLQSGLSARTLNWVGGGANTLFSNALNWKDATGGTNAVPQSGDTLTIGVDTGNGKNDIPNLYLEQIVVSGYQTAAMNGEPLYLTSSSKGISNTGYLHFDFPVTLIGTNVTYYSSSTCVGRAALKGLDGADAGIVKTGTGRAGINGFGVSDASGFAGFRFVTIREGEWIYGINGGTGKMHLLPKGQTVIFDGANTKLSISHPCVFEDFALIETDNARGKAHAISCQMDNGTTFRGKLTVTGAPADETVFTGTFETSVDFCWNPTSAAKSFVLSGKTSTTTGDVEIARGTLRLTAGAGYSQLGTLRLSGGADAQLVVDTPPNNAFHAQKLVLDEGAERIALAAGVTLTVEGALVAGARLAPGTYTAANATWLTGEGAVVVKGMVAATLKWAKLASYANLNWSTAANWTNQTTLLNGVPIDGDTIILPGNHGPAQNTYNDLVNFRPRRIYVQGGYSCPRGNPVIFDGTDPDDGVYNDGYMYWQIPLIVNTDALTLQATSNVGQQGDISTWDGHQFTIRKKGGGLLALQSNANAYTGFRRLELYEGRVSFGWQNSGNGTSFPRDLEVVFAGKDTALRCNTDTTLRGAVISETAAAAGTNHRMGRQDADRETVTLALIGEPAADSRFTGILEAPLSLLWGPANARTFTFASSNSVNVTTNALTVTNGTVRLVEGATFTQLGALVLKGGETTGFRVEAPPAQAFHAGTFTLETGLERVHLEVGVKLAVDAATVAGAALPAGVYHAAGVVGGTSVAWISGGGYLCVGGADITLPVESGDTATARWTAGGGADRALGTAANWENATLPDLTAGSLVATFAAGTGAALDRSPNFKGLELDAPGAFALTAEEGMANFAALGSRGLATTGTGKTYDIGWPLYLSAPQKWTIGAGDTVNLSATLNGVSGLSITNAGTLNVRAAQAFGGAVSLSGGTVNLDADGAFGESATQPLAVDVASTTFNLNGVTLKRPLKWLGGKAFLTLPAGKANTIAADVDFTVNTERDVDFGAGASLRIAGDWRHGQNWTYCKGLSSAEPASVTVEGRLDVTGGGGFCLKDALTLTLLSPSNTLGGVWLWMMGANCRLYTRAPFAFTAKVGSLHQKLKGQSLQNALWDLCGFDQALSQMATASGLTITSATPATLHLVTDGYAFSGWLTNACCFAGAASLSFEGTDETRLAGTSTSTGVVQVAKGTLTFTKNGSWANASEAVVKGGTLKLEQNAVFGPETTLRIEGDTGRIALDYAGRMRLKALVLDGEEQAFGTYGAAGSGAAFTLPQFTGTGVILAGTAPAATILVFR